MRRSLAVLALAGLLFTACGSDRNDSAAAIDDAPSTSTATSTNGSTGTSPTAGVDSAAVPEALQFSAPVVGGGQLDMTAYAGRTVAFWFWAPT